MIVSHIDGVGGLGIINNGGGFVVEVINFEGLGIVDGISGDIVDEGVVEFDIEDWRGGDGDVG